MDPIVGHLWTSLSRPERRQYRFLQTQEPVPWRLCLVILTTLNDEALLTLARGPTGEGPTGEKEDRGVRMKKSQEWRRWVCLHILRDALQHHQGVPSSIGPPATSRRRKHRDPPVLYRFKYSPDSFRSKKGALFSIEIPGDSSFFNNKPASVQIFIEQQLEFQRQLSIWSLWVCFAYSLNSFKHIGACLCIGNPDALPDLRHEGEGGAAIDI